jgi:exoribonuclease-2
MVTHAAPHQGLGVDQYAWSTSPLRRYTDLVNQWQILACAEHGVTAPLVAPFKPRDATLFSIVSAFDAAYAAYNDFQQNDGALLVPALAGPGKRAPGGCRGAEGRGAAPGRDPAGDPPAGHAAGGARRPGALDIVRWDEVDLSLEARLLEVAAPTPEAAAALELEEEEEAVPRLRIPARRRPRKWQRPRAR